MLTLVIMIVSISIISHLFILIIPAIMLLEVFYYTFEHSLFYCFDYIVPSMTCSMIKSIWSSVCFFNLDRKLNL